MPGIVKVRIVAGKDLPVMDRASDLTDAFVEVRLANATHKTDVCRKTLFPHWNSEWFRFEVDDEELLDEQVQIKVFDHDLYSAHDVIGKVNISLTPLLLKEGPSEIGGWFPIYDTLHGIRGYVNVRVRLDFFADSNKYHQAPYRVMIFYTSGVPQGFKLLSVQGFVDALFVNDDPEYQWIDKIRTPRASNEARLRLCAKLSGGMHRRIGQKVIDAGGNAVIGYHQSFDMEGETGIVVRGIGTAVTIVKEDVASALLDPHSPDGMPTPTFQSIHENAVLHTSGELQPSQAWLPGSAKFLSSQFLRNRTVSCSSDGGENTGESQALVTAGIESPENIANEKIGKMLGLPGSRKIIDDMEFPFFTMVQVPHGFIVHLGQIVSARSVKLLDKASSGDFAEARTAWWMELRAEVKAHAKCLGCNAVVGYSEVTTICEDLMILTAIGTAATVSLPEVAGDVAVSLQTSEKITDQVTETMNSKQREPCKDVNGEGTSLDWSTSALNGTEGQSGNVNSLSGSNCEQCHTPYLDSDLPAGVSLSKCRLCKHGKVPDLLFATIEPPDDLMLNGIGCFLQARVCRPKKKEKGEVLAESVSQILPFLEYELHQQIMNKLKIKSMNALFGWKSQISIGDQFLVGLVSATAVYVAALPPPPIFMVAGTKHSSSEEERQLLEIQKKIIDVTTKNKKHYSLVDTLDLPVTPPNTPASNSYNSTHLAPETDVLDLRGHLDLGSGVKEAYIIEMDDKRDDTTLAHLLDSGHDFGVPLFGIQGTPGLVPSGSEHQFFTIFRQRKFIDDDFKSSVKFSTLCEDAIKVMQFKVRSLKPCCLVKVTFDIEVPEDDYLQLTVTASAINFIEEFPQRLRKQGSLRGSYESADDLVFQMDALENQGDKSNGTQVSQIRRLPSVSVDRKAQDSVLDLSQSWPRSHFVRVKEPRERSPGRIERRPSVTLSGLLPRWISGGSRDKSPSQTDLLAPSIRPNVIITSQSGLPNHRIVQYLGNLNLFFIRESTSIKEDGGSSMFMQSFITEVHSVVKAHVVALSGNAVVAFSLNEIILVDSPHKNQAQCLLNVSGDVVELQHHGESEIVPHVLSPKRRMSSSSGDSLPSGQTANESKEATKDTKSIPSVETEV